MRLDPKQVKPGWRARTDKGDVERLAESIARDGQLQPIAVTTNGSDKFVLIAGARRLAACSHLGTQVSAVLVEPEGEGDLVRLQLAENVQRLDFDPLELGEGLVRWRKHYEATHETAGHGGDRRSKKDAAPRFTAEAARLLGVSEPRVYEYLSLAELEPERKREIRAAGSRRERGQAIRGVISDMRRERKKAKLAAKAEAAAPPEGKTGPVVIKCMPNARWFGKAEEGSIDLVLTDPPYGQSKSLIAHAGRKSITSDFGAWDKLDVGWVRHLPGCVAEGGQILIFTPLEGIGEYKFALEALGYTYRGAVIWHKTNPGTAHRSVYLASCEAIVWATQGKEYHFTPWDNAGKAHNHIEGPICGGSERLSHPTQKPEWIIRWLLERHSHEHSRVLDPFCGVGSVPAVCTQLGRPCIGIEKDRDFAGQALNRIKALRAAA